MFRVWEEWAVYPTDQLMSLQYIFLGLITRVSGAAVAASSFKFVGFIFPGEGAW